MGKFEENQRKMFEIEPNTYLGAHEDTNITKSAEQWLPKKNVERIQRIGSQKQRKLFKKLLLVVFYVLATIFTPKYSPTSPYFAYHAKPFPSALSGLPCLYRYMYVLRTLTRHRRTSMFLCVWEAEVICLGFLKVICHESLSLLSLP